MHITFMVHRKKGKGERPLSLAMVYGELEVKPQVLQCHWPVFLLTHPQARILSHCLNNQTDNRLIIIAEVSQFADRSFVS